MGNPNQFAVLQKEPASPGADPLKRAFKSFSNLTDADAVRLALGAHGILMRHLGQDAARALQLALQAEGVSAVVVPEGDLPKLPVDRSLQRVQLSPEAFSIYDLLGRATAVAWREVTLVAAGAVQHFEVSRRQTERTVLQFNPITGVRPTTVHEVGRKVESDSLLLLEIILAGGATRFQINAAKFPFKYVLDQPGLAIQEKFIWLVREICRQTPTAVLNAGARALHEGQESVLPYATPQSLADEMVWLLWQAAQGGGTPAGRG
jgi:hypothetical protein